MHIIIALTTLTSMLLIFLNQNKLNVLLGSVNTLVNGLISPFLLGVMSNIRLQKRKTACLPQLLFHSCNHLFMNLAYFLNSVLKSSILFIMLTILSVSFIIKLWSNFDSESCCKSFSRLVFSRYYFGKPILIISLGSCGFMNWIPYLNNFFPARSLNPRRSEWLHSDFCSFTVYWVVSWTTQHRNYSDRSENIMSLQ